MSPLQKIIGTGLLYLLTISLGIWLSRRGRPLNKALSATHKLVALGAVVVTMLVFRDLFVRLFIKTFFNGDSADIVSLALLAIAGLSIIALVATGAVLSGQAAHKTVLFFHNAATVFAAASLITAAVLTGYGSVKPIQLPDGLAGFSYTFSESKEIIKTKPYDETGTEINILGASLPQLKSLDRAYYFKSFGPVKDAESAAKAAAVVHREIFGETGGRYYVSFNENAGCWIVYDDLPPGWYGGYGYFAITMNTGEIVMAFHEK